MNKMLAEIDRRTEAWRNAMEPHGAAAQEDFDERMNVSWIYHDNAMEGLVLTYHELNAAVDESIISDSTLIPAYDNIVHQKRAIELVRQAAAKRKPPLGLEILKKIHLTVTVEVKPRSAKIIPKPPGQYRKDNPLHRLYFHEIAPPEKISYQMRKLVQWFGSDEAHHLHPVKRAAYAHHKLIGIFPWPKNSGKVSRLLMNLILLREGYLPAIIHAMERQNYYERLRQSPDELAELVARGLLSTLEAAERYAEAVGQEAVRAAS